MTAHAAAAAANNLAIVSTSEDQEIEMTTGTATEDKWTGFESVDSDPDVSVINEDKSMDDIWDGNKNIILISVNQLCLIIF